jgi:hypothetical protein
MKIRQAKAELFHADGQTDITKLIFAFRNFANVPKRTLIWIRYTNVNSYLTESTNVFLCT